MPNHRKYHSRGIKSRITLAIPVGCQLACSDNSGAKVLNVIAVYWTTGKLNRLPSASIGDLVLVSVRKGEPEMRRKLLTAVIIRQRKPWRRSDGTFIYCEDNAAVIVNWRGEPSGSAIGGPLTREVADEYPRIASTACAVL